MSQCGLDGQQASQVSRNNIRLLGSDHRRCPSPCATQFTIGNVSESCREDSAIETRFFNGSENVPAPTTPIKSAKATSSLTPDRFVPFRTNQPTCERYRTNKPLALLSNAERISRRHFIGRDPFLPRPRQSSSLMARFCPLEEPLSMLYCVDSRELVH